MEQQSVIADIEAKARGAGLSMRRVCVHAGVHPTTFSRWKRSARNPDPIGANLKTIEELYRALEELTAPPRRQRRRAAA